VALQAGLSPAEIAAVEAGEADIRLDEMTAIGEALEVKTSELIARAEALGRKAR
jgi:predicted transcriptional regulator